MTYWLTTVAVMLSALVVVTIIGRHNAPIDDGVRPVWIGHCGGVDYRWHYDPTTVMSGKDCIVDRIER